MKICYYQATDTLFIEFRPSEVAETRDLDENTLLDLDKDGHICAITVEHAGEGADIPHFSFGQILPSPISSVHPADWANSHR